MLHLRCHQLGVHEHHIPPKLQSIGQGVLMQYDVLPTVAASEEVPKGRKVAFTEVGVLLGNGTPEEVGTMMKPRFNHEATV